MSREEIIKLAEDNGYSTSGKSDKEMLKDPEFFKAAYAGQPDMDFVACSSTSPCPNCGAMVTVSASSKDLAWKVAFSAADGAVSLEEVLKP